MLLTVPHWFSAVDQQVIQSAVDRACPPQMFFLDSPAVPSEPGITELVAVEKAVDVARVIASRLPTPFPDDRRSDLDQVLAQVVVRVAAQRASPASPLADFDAAVKDALRACSWWPSAASSGRPGTPSARRVPFRSGSRAVRRGSKTRWRKPGI